MSDPPPVEEQGSQHIPIPRENRTFIIALMIIIPFMIFFGVVLLYFRDEVLLEKMTALLGGLVAAVVGYYFGQKPVRELSRQVSIAQKESEMIKGFAQDAKVDLLTLAEEYENYKKKIENLIGSQGDK